jgi:hypothetical protein
VIKVSEYEAERWRQMHDELTGQAERLKTLRPTSQAEWQAINAIESAASQLFGAFAAVLLQYQDGTKEAAG